MTGLERLRKLANDLCYDAADVSLFDMLEQGNEAFWGVSYKRDSTLRETLFAIAKQIEREHSQACEDHERQQEIIRDLQRERDEALREAKWVRERGEAEELDRCLMSKDDADWVGQYGGIDGVRDALSNDSAIVLTVINKLWPDGAPDGIAGNDDIAAEIDRRLMPPGMEWPRFEDDAPVKFGDVALIDGYADMVEAIQLWIHGRPVIYGDGGSQQLKSGERVKRPAVLAADGEPLEVGQTVYVIANGKTHHVTEVDAVSKRFRSMEQVDGSHWLDPMCFTHQRPVLDADGLPINEGDTVWFVCGGEPAEVAYTITADASHPDEVVLKGYEDDWPVNADRLTHIKPEPIDSWDKWRGEMLMSVKSYVSDVMGKEALGVDYSKLEDMATRDLMCRAKALAERERGE